MAYSPRWRGRVVRIDTTAARKTPGVIDIFHHEHFPRLNRAPESPISANAILTSSITDENRLPFEDANVHYAGQFVAVVVADTFEHAREAAFNVTVQYAASRPVENLKQGLAAGGVQGGGVCQRQADLVASRIRQLNVLH
jgi:xanthine dehydrogenase YagR molybdenum-binding subunit